MLGLRAATSKNTTIFLSQAIFGYALFLTGELATDSELPLTDFHRTMDTTFFCLFFAPGACFGGPILHFWDFTVLFTTASTSTLE